ncbi:MAG TPA: SRPBCC family protein [Jatrophihabitans sp.]|jgi:uncharacterized membrane protein|nr:SRPBCC family protein [Jatrophihabitans sp.]
MVEIRHEGQCAAPLEIAFAYLDDYRNATSWMFGLEHFQPAGAKDRGLGAQFDSTFHVRPVKLHSTIEITEWEQDTVIAFESIRGFRNWSTWNFLAAGSATTRVHVSFNYELPGGLAGRAMGRALEPIVAMSVRHSDHALRREIEARYRDASG